MKPIEKFESQCTYTAAFSKQSNLPKRRTETRNISSPLRIIMLFVALAFCATATTLAQCPAQGNCSSAWKGPETITIPNPVGGIYSVNTDCMVLLEYCWRMNDYDTLEIFISSYTIMDSNECGTEQLIEMFYPNYTLWYTMYIMDRIALLSNTPVPPCGPVNATVIKVGHPTCMMETIYDPNFGGCGKGAYHTEGCDPESDDICFTEVIICYRMAGDVRYPDGTITPITPVQCINSTRPYTFKCSAHCNDSTDWEACTVCHTDDISCYATCE